MKIIIYTRGSEAIEFIKKLLGSHYRATQIIIVYPSRESNIVLNKFGKASGIPVISDSSEILKKLSNRFTEVAIISLYYNKLLPIEIIRHADGRTLNYHPSLLPKHRGCFSSSWEIIENDEEHGLTFHKLSEEFDTGNIVYSRSFERKTYTAFDLFKIKKIKAMEYFPEVVKSIINGEKGVPQPLDGGSYHPRKLPYSGVINVNTMSEELAINLYRALYFPPHNDIIIWKKDGSILKRV